MGQRDRSAVRFSINYPSARLLIPVGSQPCALMVKNFRLSLTINALCGRILWCHFHQRDPTVRTAYSYMRFSSGQQADGDSIRRQTDLPSKWCEKNNARLDTTKTMADRGISAFHGRNRKSGALAVFLAEVEASQIERGSILLVENLDRLSRENPWDAVPLLCSIVNAGITVVTLSPSEVVYERGRDMTGLILAVIEFTRSHGESTIKAERIQAAWDVRRKRLKEGERFVFTRAMPAWIVEKKGQLVLDEEKAAVVRRIFALAIQGCGTHLIVRKLTEENVKPISGRKHWTRTYLHLILTGRASVGEFQMTRHGEPDGPPIIDYYPRVVDEETWQKANASLASRKGRAGRVGKKVAALFTGLLFDARTQSKLLAVSQGRGGAKTKRRRRVLASADGTEGRFSNVTFPADVFEKAILKLLKEIKPADVIGDEPESKSTTLLTEVGTLKARLKEIEDELTGEDEPSPTLLRAAKTLDAKLKEKEKELLEAQREELSPKSAAWKEAQDLIDLATDEPTRLRLRGLLRQIVDSMWVLIVALPGSHERIAMVQIHFAGGAKRGYGIRFVAASPKRKEKWEALSKFLLTAIGKLDLRDREQAKDMEQAILSVGA
jgi:DNA invertase Pin-like site-specific DNA recombinase